MITGAPNYPCLCGAFDCERCFPLSRLHDEEEAQRLLEAWNPRPTERGLWFLGEIITHEL